MSDSRLTETLVERAQSGEPGAFEEFAEAVTVPLRARIERRLGKKLRVYLDPEDVLQETLARVHRSLGGFQWKGRAALLRWVDQIAANCVLHAARTYGRKREISIDWEPHAQDVTPSRGVRREERFERLKRALSDLNPDHQTVIRLARIEGLRIRDISERMGRSESAVKNLLLRALRELRGTFSDTESFGLPDRSLGAGEMIDGE